MSITNDAAAGAKPVALMTKAGRTIPRRGDLRTIIGAEFDALGLGWLRQWRPPMEAEFAGATESVPDSVLVW